MLAYIGELKKKISESQHLGINHVYHTKVFRLFLPKEILDEDYSNMLLKGMARQARIIF